MHNVKTVVHRTLAADLFPLSLAREEVQDIPSSYFHPLTLAITASSSETFSNEDCNASFFNIVRDAFGNSEVLLKILRTIAYRVEECRANMKSNAQNRALAIRLIELMRFLLVHGPHAVASDFLDLIQLIRLVDLKLLFFLFLFPACLPLSMYYALSTFL